MRRIFGIIASLILLLTAASPVYALTKAEAQKIEDLKKAALEFYNKSEFDKAIPLLNQALTLDPKDKNALKYLLLFRRQVVEPYCKQAAEFYFSGHIPEAIDKWEAILKIDPRDTRVQSLIEEASLNNNEKFTENVYGLASSLWKAGRYEEAAKELQKIIDTTPNDKRAKDMLDSANRVLRENKIKELYEKAEKLMAAKDISGAVDTWQAILKIDKDQELAQRKIASIQMRSFDTLYAEARQLFVKGQYIESRDLYNKLLADNPTDKNLNYVIDRLNRVVSVIPAISDRGAASPVIRRGLAQYISKEGNPRVALASVWYAAQLEPNNPQVIAVRDFVEKELVSYIRSMDTPSVDMNLVDQYLFAALNHIYEGRYDLAVSECTMVLELDPDNILALKRMGSAYYAMGKRDKALAQWKRALQSAPNDEDLKRFIDKAN